MLNITILSVGTIKEKYLTDALGEYIKRLGAYARVTEIQCKDEHLPDNPSQAEIRAALEKEGKKPKISKWKEIIKIRAEIYEKEMKETIVKIN